MRSDGTPPRKPSPGTTAAGFALGGGLFLALGLYLNLATGFGITDNLGPVGILGLIGATVGGLVAPLLSSLLGGRREGEEDPGREGLDDPTGEPLR